MEQNFLFYKGYPLVRSGDCFYYGYMCEPHVIMIRVTKKDTSGVIPIASELQVYDLSTDENKSLRTAQATVLVCSIGLSSYLAFPWIAGRANAKRLTAAPILQP